MHEQPWMDRPMWEEPSTVATEEIPDPRSVELPRMEERRRYPRLARRSPLTVIAGPWYRRQRIHATLTSLSATGVAFTINHPIRLLPGTPVALKLDVPPPPTPLGGVSGRVRCTVRGTVLWAARDPATGRAACGVRLSKLIQEWLELQETGWQRFAFLGAAVFLGLTIAFFKTSNVVWFWYDPLFQLYSLLVTLYICSRSLLALFYHPPADRGLMPSVSMVIAVKNEEAHIARTVERCFQSRYPAALLEVLVIDDGSTDGTWERLSALQPRYPGLKIFKFPENRGKRHAMALGAQRAAGEILVYVDSDSYVDPEGLYRIVQGFAEPRIGAVAGHVEVIVDPNNIISKMESVRYFISHRVMKAAESLFGCVTCCSGAFSAYRRSAVMPVLEPWLNQTFLGQRATFGDDRSLTNFVLQRYEVVFCESARCKTYVPENFHKYFRQQLRWKKSWSRETLVASRLMIRKHPAAALSYYVGVLLTLCAPVMVVRNMVILPLVDSASCLPYITGLVLVYLFFCCIFLYFTRSAYWYYGLVFAGLYITVLCWQNYYAMATVSKTHWGTR